MSIDHSIEIIGDSDTSLKINIAGLNESSESINTLSASFYAYSKDSCDPIFTCSFDINQLRLLYAYLSEYSIITDIKLDSTGRFIELDQSNKLLQKLISSADKESLIKTLETVIS